MLELVHKFLVLKEELACRSYCGSVSSLLIARGGAFTLCIVLNLVLHILLSPLAALGAARLEGIRLTFKGAVWGGIIAEFQVGYFHITQKKGKNKSVERKKERKKRRKKLTKPRVRAEPGRRGGKDKVAGAEEQAEFILGGGAQAVQREGSPVKVKDNVPLNGDRVKEDRELIVALIDLGVYVSWAGRDSALR